MTTLVETPFSLEQYTALKFPKNALCELKPHWLSAAYQLNDVFVKHNMFDLYQLSLLHRHHPLQQGELLVEHVSSTVSVTQAEAPCADHEILSHVWKVEGDHLIPMEFLDITTASGLDKDQFRTARARLLVNQDFITELGAVLRATKTQDVLGIQVVHRDGLRTEERPFLSECSDTTLRQSVVTPVEELPCRDVPVAWPLGPTAKFCAACIPDYWSDECNTAAKYHTGDGSDEQCDGACATSNCGCGCRSACGYSGGCACDGC